jgi:uncharacterized protein (TIGR01777 family)
MTFVLVMATVLITGGTGLIGTALTKELLKKDYDVIILTRFPEKHTATSKLSYAGWNIEEKFINEKAIAKADYIIHLAGTNVGEHRWTKKGKKQIVESRTKSAALLVKALTRNANSVKAIISASAIGWYGPDSDNQNANGFVETDPNAEDFLGTTCKEWEQSIDPIADLKIRLVKLRTGVVIANEGMIKEFKKPLRFGIATILGNGKQVISWISIEDIVRLYISAIEKENLSGVYNAVAPYPVSNKELVMQLARNVRGKFFVPVFIPSFILKLVLGEMSIEVLKSATVSCKKIKGTGFTFTCPSIKSAIQKQEAS